MTKAQLKALHDIATGRDPKLSHRSPDTVRELHVAGLITSVGAGHDWRWELTEYGANLLAGR